MKGCAWTADEIAIVRMGIAKKTPFAEIAKKAGRSLYGTYHIAYRLRLWKAKPQWTKADILRLRSIYAKRTLKELMPIFKRSYGAIAIKANSLGIRKHARSQRYMLQT